MHAKSSEDNLDNGLHDARLIDHLDVEKLALKDESKPQQEHNA
jgi:hypothetical protein